MDVSSMSYFCVTHYFFILVPPCEKIVFYEDQHKTTSEIISDSDMNLASQTLENTASTSS